MRRSKLLPILLLMLTSLALAQSAPSGQRAQRHEQMKAMCKEHVDAMKADVQKMHSAFDKMKASVASVSNADEKARWQANIDMWQSILNHHDQMLKHMEDAQAKEAPPESCRARAGNRENVGGRSP